MVVRAGSTAGGSVISGLLRAVALLGIGLLGLIGGFMPAHAHAGLPLPPAARRAPRPSRRLPVPPAFHRPVLHRIVHQVIHRWHPVRRVIDRHPIIRHIWHPAPHPIWHPAPHPVLHPVVWRPRPWHAPARMLRLSCVPFARADSGIDLSGDAFLWWAHAAGRYARGDMPVPGSVLAFRPNVRMRLGHVAVVSRVINRREVEVDQANWGDGGRITRGVPVIDVSEDNNWTEVRVALGGGRFGSVYPTFGFIYDRPDTGTLIARGHAPAPVLAANPAPSDLRALHLGGNEVASLPGPLPAPPRWPARLTHTLHVHFVHRDMRRVAYRPRLVHRVLHHAVVRHVVLHHVAPHRRALPH